MLLTDESEPTPVRSSIALEDVVHEVVDLDLDDSDFEPGADRELLGLFFPEVRIRIKHFGGFLSSLFYHIYPSNVD